jgi:hypothetical protein
MVLFSYIDRSVGRLKFIAQSLPYKSTSSQNGIERNLSLHSMHQVLENKANTRVTAKISRDSLKLS